MKKKYMKPIVDKIEFDYTAVVVTSGCQTGGATYFNNTATSGGCSSSTYGNQG